MRKVMLASLCTLAASTAAAQEPVQQFGFVTTLGRDTIAVEQARRTQDRIDGELVVFTPATQVFRYTMRLTPAGTIHSSTLEVFQGAGERGATPTVRVSMERHETRLVRITTRGRQVDTLRLEVPALTIPQLGNSMVIYEQMARQAARQGGVRVPVTLMPLLGGSGVQENALVLHGRDTMALDFFGSAHLLHVDDSGRLLGMDGRQSTFKVVAQRVEGALDIGALAAAGAARDRAGRGLGALSTRDTATAVIGGAELSVDYGRPAVRGRRILGGVVPFGEVWRTGANNPTRFSTSRDLQIGERTLPAGSYTLLSLPTEAGAEIIFSRQPADTPGYDPAFDLARIPAEVRQGPAPVERLTITMEPGEGGNGALVIAWHTFVWRVPFRVR